MNGKQAKRLRKMVKGIADSVRENGTEVVEKGYALEEHKMPNPRSTLFSSSAADRNKDEPLEVTFAITVRNHPKTERAVYRELKKVMATKA